MDLLLSCTGQWGPGPYLLCLALHDQAVYDSPAPRGVQQDVGAETLAEMELPWAQTHKTGQNHRETPVLLKAVKCFSNYAYLLDVFTNSTTWPTHQQYNS